jgi:hypothetical protein
MIKTRFEGRINSCAIITENKETKVAQALLIP